MTVSALLFTLLVSASSCPFASLVGAPTEGDIARQLKTAPSAAFQARGGAAIRKNLNTHLRNGPLALPRAKPCEHFTVSELNKIQRQLLCLRDSTLTYSQSDGRNSPHTDLTKLQDDQDDEEAYILGLTVEASRAVANAALRDAKCHEIAMSWTHHLNDESREHLTKNSEFAFPLLPEKGVVEHK